MGCKACPSALLWGLRETLLTRLTEAAGQDFQRHGTAVGNFLLQLPPPLWSHGRRVTPCFLQHCQQSLKLWVQLKAFLGWFVPQAALLLAVLTITVHG